MNRRHSDPRTLAAAAVVLAVVLAGCGSASSGDSATLSEAQLETVLLTVDDLAPGFTESPVGDDSSQGAASLNDEPCLAGLGDDDASDSTRVEAHFDRAGLIPITSAAASYAGKHDLGETFDEARDAFASCSDFEVGSDGGSSIKGTLESDDTAATDVVDDQINVRITATQQPSGLPVEISFSLARIGNDVVTVSAEGTAGPSEESFQELVRTTAERLADVRAED